MTLLAQDATGDLLVTNGKLSLITGGAAIAQDLFNRFRLFLGEWFLDQRVGIPYFQVILGQRTDPGIIRQFIVNIILDTPGITGVTSATVSIDPVTRALSGTFEATCDTGETISASALDKPFIVNQPRSA